MPERPQNEQYRRPQPLDRPPAPRKVVPRYAELHCYTNFSFLHGASHPDELAQRAAELGYAALAITDRHSLAGVVRAHVAAKDVGLKLLIGAEVTPTDGPPLVLLATDRPAYGRLADLLSRGKMRAPKGECHLTVTDIAEFAPGLLACVPLAGRTDLDAICVTVGTDWLAATRSLRSGARRVSRDAESAERSASS
jgi:hypothetical protein